MDARKILANLLLGFVLISIGFALGRQSASRKTPATAAAPPPATRAAATNKVIVFYLHQTYRCVTCNRIEAMTADVVRSAFAREMADGRVEWRRENFQEKEELARRYNVASSSVVVVQVRNGRESAHQTLENVWTLADKPEEFAAYVGGAVRGYLGGEAP